jgi:protein-tyrosine phosphatase
MFTALHLDWPDCRNARDLGGMPLAGGRVLRERALVRSDSHSYLTESGIAALRAYGVSRAIDLRRQVELDKWPSLLATDVAYLNLPVQNPEDSEEETTLADLYRALLDRRPELFAAALIAIAEAPPGAVVVHCAAGKDRTGLVIAMVLSLLGASEDVIAADYALTDERLRSRYEELIAAAATDAERDWWQSIRWAEPANITGALKHLRDKHGGVERYLSIGGFNPGHRDALIARLVDGTR